MNCTPSGRCSYVLWWIAAAVMFSSVVSINATAQSRGSVSHESQTGTPVSVSGELTVTYLDDFDRGRSELVHAIQDARTGKSLRLRFDRPAPKHLRSGQRVTVRGRSNNTDLYVAQLVDGSSGGPVGGAGALQQSGPLLGEQKTVVLLVNFRDNPSQPYTVAQAENVLLSEVNGFVQETSSNQTWITGNVFGWFTLQMDSTVCDSTTVAQLARQAAAAAGVNLANYGRYIYAHPQNACNFSGGGTVGGNPSEAWINGNFALKVIGHELGHNFGLSHAHFLDCDGGGPIAPPCTGYDYGNVIDIMGSNAAGHYNAFMKERLGWLAYGNSPSITTVTSSGTYYLEPLSSTSAGGAKALRILKSVEPTTGVETWYYVEFRQAIGYDSFLSGSGMNVLNGVIVQTASPADGNSSNVLDMTPSTASWFDHALTVGSTFSDETAGVTLTPTSVSAAGASVTITLATPACIRGNPSVALSPFESPTLRAGSQFTYSMSVTSTDLPGCAPGAFGIGAISPSGWISAVSSPTMTLGPGASGSATVQVTSPPTAEDGAYGISVVATSATNQSGTASGSYRVLSALSVPASTGRASYARNQKADMRADVLAGTAPAAGANVTFRVRKPDGTSVSGAAVSDANGAASYALRLRAKDPVGTYYVMVLADWHSLQGTGATSFIVR